MAFNYIAEFPRQEICKKRQYGALIKWSAYITAQPIPTEKPAKDWVEQRIVAEKIPAQPDNFVSQTLGFTVRDPAVVNNIYQHLNPFNDPAVEPTVDGQVEAAVSAQMRAFCASLITQGLVDQWYIEHGFTVTVAEAGPMIDNPLDRPVVQQ